MGKAVERGDTATYFNKFYVKGYDNGAYIKKLAHFLSGLNGLQRIDECFRQYDCLSKLPDDFCDVLEIYRLIERELYKAPIEELLNLPITEFQKLSRLNEMLVIHKIKTSGKYELLYVLAILNGKFGTEQSLKTLIKGGLYSGLSSQQLSFLAENYIEKIIEFYLTSRKKGGLETVVLLQNIFGVPFKASYGFDNCLIKGLKLLKDKDHCQFVADLTSYAFCREDDFACELKSFIVKYTDTLKKTSVKNYLKEFKTY